MRYWIFQLRNAQSREELMSLAENFSHELGFERFDYFIQPKSLKPNEFRLHHNHELSWAALRKPLLLDGRGNEHIQRITEGCGPFAFNYDQGIFGYVESIPDTWAVLQRGFQLGMASGLVAPIHSARISWGLMCMSSETYRDLADLEELTPKAFQFASYLYLAERDVLRRTKSGADSDVMRLTPREIEVLTWAVHGKTSWEIAQILGLSQRTVDGYFAQASEKLGSSSRNATVAQAALLGMITP